MTRDLRDGFTLVEVLIVIAIVGVLGVVTFVNLPRDRFAVGQAAQLTAQAVRMARLEAVKRDTNVAVVFTKGSSTFAVVRTDTSAVLHSYTLDPQGTSSITVTSDSDSITFNPRGVTTVPTSHAVVLTYAKSGYSKTLNISLQGSVEIQ